MIFHRIPIFVSFALIVICALNIVF